MACEQIDLLPTFLREKTKNFQGDLRKYSDNQSESLPGLN